MWSNIVLFNMSSQLKLRVSRKGINETEKNLKFPLNEIRYPNTVMVIIPFVEALFCIFKLSRCLVFVIIIFLVQGPSGCQPC